MSVPCMYMFVFFNNGMYYVCQLTYDSTVHSLYVHGTDMYVHVYARWSGFQMSLPTSHLSSLPLQPLLPPTPFAAAAGASAASQWSSRAGLGRAGPDVFRPSRAGCGPAGPGRAGFCSQRRRSCIATPTGGAADGLRMRPRRSETRARAPLRKAE